MGMERRHPHMCKRGRLPMVCPGEFHKPSRSPRTGSISSIALPARAGLRFPIEIRTDKTKQTVNWLQIGFSDAVSTAAHFLEKPRPVCLRRGFFVVANRHLAGLPIIDLLDAQKKRPQRGQ